MLAQVFLLGRWAGQQRKPISGEYPDSESCPTAIEERPREMFGKIADYETNYEDPEMNSRKAQQ